MKIIFVCTGNTCRSPMAEVIAKNLFEENNINAQISSAGIMALSGARASKNAIKAAELLGLDLSLHTSSQFTIDLFNNSDIILTMTQNHKDAVLSVLQNASISDELHEKVFTVAEYAGLEHYDISDPFAQSLSVYQDCAEQLKFLINKIVERINKQYDSNR